MRTPYKSPEKLLEEYGEIIRPIKGTSMLPMLREACDAVRILPVKEELKVGDVPLYRKPNGQYVLHRIVGVEAKRYIIRGDNCTALENVPKRWVVGVASGFFRDGEYISESDPEYRKYVDKVLAAGKPLIPQELNYLLKLYAAAITQTPPPEAPEGLDWPALLQKSNRQLITAVVATAVEKLKTPPPADIFEAFVKARYAALRRDILYDVARETIYGLFEQEKIPYASLKGIIIKEYYPARGVREFTDNDILVDVSREKRIKRIMKDLGYTLTAASPVHDTYCKDNIYCFEMHKRLFDEDSVLHYDNVWDHFETRKPDSVAHYMSDEEFYIYFIAHYAKHRKAGGAGVRFLGDLYFLKKNVVSSPNFDRGYVAKRLEELKVSDIEEIATADVESLFSEGTLSDEEIRECFSGAVHGTYARAIASTIRSKGKFGYIMYRFFPPIKLMRCRYPVLKKCPILLPILWVVRLLLTLFNSHGRKEAVQMFKVWKSMKKDND